MTGDRYAFRQRFNRWKQGERYWSIIGQPLPHYADGKDSDQEYYGYMERLANKKAGDWAQVPLRIDPDVTLTEMLNDNTYNYRTFYDNDRYLAEGMLYDNPYAHFSDTGKTVYHPTFSTDSNYSNRKSDYNPEGIEGGSWINNEYRVSRDQMNSKYFNPRRTLNYLKHSDPNVQMVLPQYRGGKNSKSSFVQQLETQSTVLQPAVQEWGDMWKERMEPAAKSKVLQKWNATGRKPKPETSQEYTNRRIKEETKRTWRSDAADIAHGIGEGILALNPYTAIPYYGAKVGQDVLSGNVNWNTALNASVPLFHLSPQAVGLREATNAVLEDAANAGSKTARNWRVARELRNPQISKSENPTRLSDAERTRISSAKTDYSDTGTMPNNTSFFEKMIYQNKIRGFPNLSFSGKDDAGNIIFSPDVTKGLSPEARKDVMYNTVDRNVRERKLRWKNNDEYIDEYRDRAQNLLDDVNVGRYSKRDYIKAGEEDTGGFFDKERNFISINKDSSFPETFIEKHEARHLLDNDSPLGDITDRQFDVLTDAYDNDFTDLPNTKYAGHLKGYQFIEEERLTTNRDARDVLFGRFGKHFRFADHNLQDLFIDMVPDDKIFKAVETSNGYGRRFIEFLRDNGKLTPEKAQQFREAMKHVGVYSVPISISYNTYKNRKSKKIRPVKK